MAVAIQDCFSARLCCICALLLLLSYLPENVTCFCRQAVMCALLRANFTAVATYPSDLALQLFAHDLLVQLHNIIKNDETNIVQLYFNIRLKEISFR